MSGGMVGADADILTATARQFGRSSEVLRTHRVQLGAMYTQVRWVGADADRSRGEWQTVGAPSLLRTIDFLAALEARLLEHVADQRRASAAIPVRYPPTPVHNDRLGRFVGFPDGLANDVVEELFGGDGADQAPTAPVRAEPVAGLRPDVFGSPTDGRAAVLDAMRGLADEHRIGRDEIEIRALDNGRYVVVLPGVTDLSAGVDEFVDRVRDDPFGVGDAGREAYDAWADNDEPTVRKMQYAFEAALRDDATVNEYSVVTAEALETAGVPAGADIMIIGHSFGAYTAMDLAADPSFNAAHGAKPSGYHLQITHVIAAGAETDWRFDEVPATTSTLVLNNRLDLVYRVEDLLHPDGDAVHAGHLERNFWGEWQGKGHDEHNYLEWLAGTGDDDVVAWFDDIGDRYTSSGTRVSAQVPDPNL